MVVRNHVERTIRATFESFGFQQIQTPTFETFDLFAARSGEEIRESMFTFASDAGRYALRPELTAPVCRLVASGALQNLNLPEPYKLYYFGPCFRYCRPQEGRYREFYQVGVELMGASDELSDAEMIALAIRTIHKLGIEDYHVKIGDVGIFQQLLTEGGSDRGSVLEDWQMQVLHGIDRVMHVAEMCRAIAGQDQLTERQQAFLANERQFLYHLQDETDYSGDGQISMDEDATAEALRKQAAELPKIAEMTFRHAWTSQQVLPEQKADLLLALSRLRGNATKVLSAADELLKNTAAAASLDRLQNVCNWLETLGVSDFEVVLGTVRNLDFYTGTVFEIDSPLLGVPKQLCGGGRYDRLVSEFAGPAMPATGFAFGFDRLVEVFKSTSQSNGFRLCVAPVDVVVINDGADLRPQAVQLSQRLRDCGLRVGVDLCGRSFAEQVEYAKQLNAQFMVILDRDSILHGNSKLRQRKSDSEVVETTLSLSAIADQIQQRKSEENR
jgi:histidyl-tRNA synthetase